MNKCEVMLGILYISSQGIGGGRGTAEAGPASADGCWRQPRSLTADLLGPQYRGAELQPSEVHLVWHQQQAAASAWRPRGQSRVLTIYLHYSLCLHLPSFAT